MRIENSRVRPLVIIAGVFVLCVGAGWLSGVMFRESEGDADAASASITVTDNNQVVTEDQGTTTIQRTSTVTIKDTTATIGYKLSAKASSPHSTTTIPGATVTMYPTVAPTAPNTSTCTQASPCILPVDDGSGTTTPLEILSTGDNTATQTAGDTTEWTVTITLPGGTAQGNYILDIAYSQDPILPPPAPQEPNPSTPTTYGAMQLMTNAECSTTRGTAFDARNGQTYYVQKIGNLCWMETNLRYAGYDGNTEQWDNSWGYNDDRYATTTALAANTANQNDNTRPLIMTTSNYMGNTTSTTNAYTVAGVKDAGGSTEYTNTTANGGFYGYLYNWCSAMGGQPNACNQTSTTGFDTTQSICPAGWRLPTGGSGGEYQALNNAINSGSTSSDAGLRNNFLAVYSGNYYSALAYQGSYGYVWSSSVNSASNAYSLYFNSGGVYPAVSSNKNYGFAVRCVL